MASNLNVQMVIDALPGTNDLHILPVWLEFSTANVRWLFGEIALMLSSSWLLGCASAFGMSPPSKPCRHAQSPDHGALDMRRNKPPPTQRLDDS